jgi:hypothetical protein
MFTNQGLNDVHQVELLKQDKQRQLKALYTAPVFEGVSLQVNEERRGGPSLFSALAGLFRKPARPSTTAQPLRRQHSRA